MKELNKNLESIFDNSALNFFYDNNHKLINLYKPMLNYKLGISSELLEIGKNFQDNNSGLLKILKPLSDFQNTLNNFSNVFKGITSDLQKNFEELPEKLKSSIMILANEGWFVSNDISLQLLLEINHKQIDEIEEELILYYEEKLDLIQAKLIETFPNRASILSNAFDAHKNEMYELSVPVFLIQADGICLDLINRNFFGKRDNEKYFEDYIKSNVSGAITEEFLRPLKEKIPLVQNEKQRSENFNKLNRHLILHGGCTDYANKINSLKSISFISYLFDNLSKQKR
ncbi:hypothetical protein ACNSOS_01005 [Aliarcobacter vitoriensis]|uniref:hypothetical protein n=1 Tax=Aliarcobacter vitoriensis TaxID=2011099 RepID=UPI003AABC85B